MKYVLLISLFCFFNVGLFGWSGSGTENDPYQIITVEDLSTLAENVYTGANTGNTYSGVHFKLMNDLDLNVAPFNIDQGWMPIGLSYCYESEYDSWYVNRPFSGIFDGNNCTISHLFINRIKGNCLGLFGITQGATIKNLNLTGVNVNEAEDNTNNADGHVGSISGYISESSEIYNCHVEGSVQGNYRTGGIVGSCSISNISNTSANMTVSGTVLVGGLIGTSDGNSNISNCQVSCIVNGNSSTGGIIGNISQSNLSNSYFTGEINCSSIGFGGLVGDITFPIEISNSFYNYENTLINNQHCITIGAIDGDLYNQWLDSDFSLNINNYMLEEEDSFVINNASDLRTMLAFVYNDYNFKLDSDIDLTNETNFYIPYFKGSFDGNNYIISNLNFDISDFSRLGFFGVCNDSRITNLNIQESSIAGKFWIGGLIGHCFTSDITYCSFSGSVSGLNVVGGLIGYSKSSSINHCSSEVHIETISGINLGGLIGSDNNSQIFSCSSNSFIDGDGPIGGLIGDLFNSEISNSFSFTSINASYMAGGLIGSCYISDVDKCYSDCNIINSSNYSGGFIGFSSGSTINNSFSKGIIQGEDYSGGFIGSALSTINNCYSNVVVTGEDYTGGFIGSRILTQYASSCYWDIECSGLTNGVGEGQSEGIFGRTTDEMTFSYAQNTYEIWDFDNIWVADENYEYNNGYPYLYGMEPVGIDETEQVPPHVEKYTLSNYPNPFNPSTTISFSLKEKSSVSVKIFNTKGQLVRDFGIIKCNKGENTVFWDGKDNIYNEVASGIYLTRMTSNKHTLVKKMLLLK